MIKLVEIEPGKWRINKPPLRSKRSNLPLPNIISDIMEPTEQVDGKFYTSKRQFRAVGRSLGLVEVGTEKLTPKVVRASTTKQAKEARVQSIKKAVAKVNGG